MGECPLLGGFCRSAFPSKISRSAFRWLAQPEILETAMPGGKLPYAPWSGVGFHGFSSNATREKSMSFVGPLLLQ